MDTVTCACTYTLNHLYNNAHTLIHVHTLINTLIHAHVYAHIAGGDYFHLCSSLLSLMNVMVHKSTLSTRQLIFSVLQVNWRSFVGVLICYCHSMTFIHVLVVSIIIEGLLCMHIVPRCVNGEVGVAMQKVCTQE